MLWSKKVVWPINTQMQYWGGGLGGSGNYGNRLNSRKIVRDLRERRSFPEKFPGYPGFRFFTGTRERTILFPGFRESLLYPNFFDSHLLAARVKNLYSDGVSTWCGMVWYVRHSPTSSMRNVYNAKHTERRETRNVNVKQPRVFVTSLHTVTHSMYFTARHIYSRK